MPLNTVLAARTRIAIDRVTGHVAMKKMGAQRSSGATFAESPLASGTRFQMTAVSIDNVALWQIGLLALVMREMSEGTVRLGKGTRQGLGHIRIAISSLSIRYPALSSESATFAEIKEAVAHIPALSPAENNWRQALWTEHKLGNGTLQDFLRFCVECALAPRLRAGHDAGREGFFAAQTEKGVV